MKHRYRAYITDTATVWSVVSMVWCGCALSGFLFLPRDASAERGYEIAFVCLVCDV